MRQNRPLGDAAAGYDKPYEQARGKAKAELDRSQTDRHADTVKADDTDIKNPEGELYNPAPMPASDVKAP